MSSDAFKNMKQAIENGPDIVRLDFATGGNYYKKEFVLKLIDELSLKTTLVRIGMDEFTSADILCLTILKDTFGN